MSFIARIASASEIDDVFELVNEFIDAMRHSNEMAQIPAALRPGRIDNAGDLMYWLSLIIEDMHRQYAAEEDISNAMFGLHAVLERAVQKLDGI